MERIPLSRIPVLERAINALGATEAERAQALNLSERALRTWRNDGIPPSVLRLLRAPGVVAALAATPEDDNLVISDVAA